MTPSGTSADDGVRTVAKLLTSDRTAFLTTTDATGALTSRPMAVQEVEFDGDLWFFTARSSRKVAQIAAQPRVNVSVGSGSSWVSLAGTATVVDDAARKRELWNAVVEAWFPDGADDPDVVLLRVDGDSAEYWDTPGGRVATVLSFAKAKATGKPASGGENETVQL
jgi:general stress protein 26